MMEKVLLYCYIYLEGKSNDGTEYLRHLETLEYWEVSTFRDVIPEANEKQQLDEPVEEVTEEEVDQVAEEDANGEK